MSPASFQTLPPDLKLHILNFVTSQQTRIALAKTCKDWYPSAIGAAYQTVRFSLCPAARSETACAELAMAMLSPENVGLKSIRHLTLVPCQNDCNIGAYAKEIRTALGLFAHLLPRDQLHTFSLESFHVLEPDLLTTLHQRQRYLQSLRLDGWRTDTDNCLSENLLQDASTIVVTHVTRLQLFISSKWKAEWFNIPSLPALKRLEIYADLASIIQNDGEFPADDPQQHRELSQVVLEDVFGEEHELSQLEGLGLRGLDLQDAGRLLRSTIGSGSLRSLTIQHCRNVTAFVKHCAEDDSLLHGLRSINIVNSTRRDLNDRAFCVDVNQLNLLLQRLDGLERIMLILTALTPNQTTLKGLQAQSLTRHAKTLQYAYLDIARHDADTFINNIAECTKLRQLALPTSKSAVMLSGGELSSILGEGAVDAMSQLLELRTLHILDDVYKSPNLDASLSQPAVFGALRSHRLAQITSWLFASIPHLSVIGFGRREKKHTLHQHSPSKTPSGFDTINTNMISNQAAQNLHNYQYALLNMPTGPNNHNHNGQNHQAANHNHLSNAHWLMQGTLGQGPANRHRQHADTEQPHPTQYMRSVRRDLDGVETVEGTRVDDLERIRAVEPAIDCLEVVADGNRSLAL